MRDIDTIKGCIVGGAVGDALGYAVEFMRLSDIVRKYGEKGITRYELDGGLARISDDTQMTLFTATALLFGETRGRMREIGPGPVGYFREAYQDWYRTQTERFSPKKKGKGISWLANFEEFYSRRAPGTTCMSALGSEGYYSINRPANQSKGCGGVMRVAPIGVYLAGYRDEKGADLAGAEAAAVTHGHELGYIPAAALVHIVYELAASEKADVYAAVLSSMEAMPGLFPNAGHMQEFLDIMEKAVALSRQDVDDREAIRRLGEGWVGEEALAIAVYCALKHSDSFEDAIVASVNHSGDSDSTGAVTGNILGTALGYRAIPDHYLEKLELRDIIEEVAQDLYEDCKMSEYSDYRDPVWESKYIYIDYDAEKRTEQGDGSSFRSGRLQQK